MSNNNEQANLLAMIQALQAENQVLKAKATQVKTKGKAIRVSPKGGVSVYGLGKWPTTLYATQWFTLLEMAQDIKQFIEDNKGSLTVKSDGGAV